MPLSKIIWSSPITSVSQTFLNNEKGYCLTQIIILFLSADIKTIPIVERTAIFMYLRYPLF